MRQRPCTVLVVIGVGLTLGVTAWARTVTDLVGESGAFVPQQLAFPASVVVDSLGNVYTSSGSTGRVFKITPGGVITVIVDETGDGAGNAMGTPGKMALDASDNVYVTSRNPDGAFKVTPTGVVTQIIDATGDGAGNVLTQPAGIAVDPAGNVYVAGTIDDNVFRITPAGVVTELADGFTTIRDIDVDSIGNVFVSEEGFFASDRRLAKVTPAGVVSTLVDFATHGLTGPSDVTVDASDNAYVADPDTDRVFRVTPAGVVTAIIGLSGDGVEQLVGPAGIAVDAAGNAFITGHASRNLFRVTPAGVVSEVDPDDGPHPLESPGAIAIDGTTGDVIVANGFGDNVVRITPSISRTQIIDSTGAYENYLGAPVRPVVDAAGDVYVAGASSNNVFRFSAGGVATKLLDWRGDGAGAPLDAPRSIAVDSTGAVYVASGGSDTVLKRDAGGTITVVVDGNGAGVGEELVGVEDLVVDSNDNLYVSGLLSNNVLRVTPSGVISTVIDATGDGAGAALDEPRALAIDSTDNLYVAGGDSDNVFKVTPAGTITEILAAGGGFTFIAPGALAVDPNDNLYVGTTSSTSSVFRIEPGGAVSTVIDSDGDGVTVLNVRDVAADAGGVYASTSSNLAFYATPAGAVSHGVPLEQTGSTSPLELTVGPDANLYVASFPASFEGSGQVLLVDFECDPAPRIACRQPTQAGKAGIVVRDKRPGPNKSTALKFKWTSGEATALADFGDPTATDDYAVCIYDDVVPTAARVLEAEATTGGLCGSKPCWKAAGSGYKFKAVDPVDGVRKVALRAGPDGKAKATIVARGERLMKLALPAPLPFVVQLQASNGECWEAEFFAGGVRRNNDIEFRGVAGIP